MLLKIGLLAVALLLGWLMLRRGAGAGSCAPRRRGPARLGKPSAMALRRCPDCGVHYLPGAPCGCEVDQGRR